MLVNLEDLSIGQIQALLLQAIEAKAVEANLQRLEVAETIASLQSLLGPANSAPGLTSIRAVQAYGDATIAQNPGQAVVLILAGMEELTKTVLKLAQVVAND